MSVVFGLADRITVLVYGEVIASGTPAEIRGNAAVQEAYLGDGGGMMLEVRDLHAYYGKSHILQGVDLRCRRRRDRQPAGPQRRRPLDHLQGDHGRWCRRRARSRFKGQDDRRAASDQIAHAGIGYVPEDRQIFPSLTVRQNLELGLKRAGEFGRWKFDDVFALFPNLGARARQRGRRAVGRRAADADHVPHADGRSRPGHDRRADRGPGAQLVEQVGELLAEIARRGVAILLVEQKLTIALQDLAPGLCHGPRPHRVRGHAGRAGGQRRDPQGMAGSLRRSTGP